MHHLRNEHHLVRCNNKGDISLSCLSHHTALATTYYRAELLHPWIPNMPKPQNVFHKRHRPPLYRISLSSLVERAFSLQLFHILSCLALRRTLRHRWERSSSLGSKVAPLRPEPVPCPESLPLHDVPQLAQVGLGNDVVRLELQRTQVVGLRFGKLPVQVEDGTEVHQSSRVLGEGTEREV